MFEEPADIIGALIRYKELYDPNSGSIIMVTKQRIDPYADPFRRGFISNFDERAELVRLLRELDERERRLLILWYVFRWPVGKIGRSIGVTREHCYRLKAKALETMLDLTEETPQYSKRSPLPARTA